MNKRLSSLLLPLLLMMPSTGTAAFDLEAWKLQYGTALTPGAFYSSRPGPWGDYFSSSSVDCANATFLYLGPLGIKARPFDQALSTAAFSALYPQTLVDSSGLIQNAFGVMDAPAGSPSDGKVYPGDVILEMEDQRIKTATEMTFPFTMLAKDSRGLEIHAGQLVDAAEGRGAIKLKLLRAALTAYDGGTITAPATTAEVSVNVSGQDYVRLTGVSANNCLTNWINPRLEDGVGGVLYLNAQTIVQKCGYASPQMGKDATGATVYDGATAVTNCIGTRANSMIEYAVPAGYTTLKFKVQATGTGSVSPSIKTRKTTVATTPAVPRQYDANGAPILPPELAPYLETIEYSIPQIGSFGSAYDPNSEKVANYAAILAHRLASSQSADGSWPSGGGDYANAHFRTALGGLGLLATGDPAYTTHIQKAATFVANNDPGGWSYPRGTRLMFLAEYYLRTRDASILPGLQNAVEDAENNVLGDFTAGHGLNVGYGGSGYIGATGTISTGLAIASHTPARVDLQKLDNMLERVQELAGGNNGGLPYSRGGIGRGGFPETPSNGQSYSCGAGGVLATKIRGGPQYITELFRKKFGQAAAYGDADGGHASEALTFIMGSLACQIWGDDSHKANMDRFLWRLTLKRDYSGYINLNTNRLEYHGGDGGCHGGPIYDTGGYLILLNAHKHNLAITGKPEAQAQVFPNTPPTYDVDRKLYWRILNDWNMVDAALGSKMPAALQPKLAELRSMPLGSDLGARSLAFLQREALAAATAVNAIAGLTNPEKQHYCEMLLGIGHDITVASIDSPVPTTGLSNYRFSLNGYTASTTWDSWGGPTPSTEPAPSTLMTGSVTLTDPSGTYLAAPVTLNFAPGNLNPTTTFQVPVTQQVNFTATFNYTVGGSLPVSYTRDIIINPAVPFNVDSRAGDYTNVRKVWIPGNCPIPFEKWNMPVQLPSGRNLAGASKNEGSIGFHTYDNGTLVTADAAYQARIAGKPAGYWVVSSDRWGEAPVLGVNLLQGASVTTTAVSAINPTFATSGGNVTSDSGWPVTARGVCWSTSPYPTIYDDKTVNGTATGTFTSSMTGLLPGTVYHVRAYATNAIGTSYGEDLTFNTAGSNGTWTTAGGGSWTNTANWLNGIDASGADGIADFGTVTPSGSPTITLDGPRSIGGMIFGNPSFTGNWILNSGTGGNLSLDIGITGDPTITVNGGTATLNTVIEGTDGLVKAGTGTLVLSASNIFTGITAVNAGTLQLGGVLSDGSPVTVAAGGTLTGTGTIGANTNVAGTVSPGVAGIGKLNIEAALGLSGTTAMEINKTAASSDKLTGMSSLTYGGTLTVTNLAGTLAAGDTFTLFSASSYSGSFSTLNLPALTGGLKWDTSKLAVNGSIQVGNDPAITGQPANQSVGQGVSASFTVTATGIPSPAYQWQVSTNSGSTWSPVSGATGATYATPPTTSGDNNSQFRCVVSNSLASVTSNAAVLTVTANSLPTFTSQPADVVLAAASQTATFTAVATGTPAPTYRWQVSTNAGGTWTNISGATSSTYSFTAAAGDDNKAYRCVATNSQGSRNSDMALLLIAPVPTWTNPLGGSWPTAANWFNNNVASGSGITADFSRLDLTANRTVTLDGARTIGNLKFGDATATYGWTLATGSAGPLTLSGTTPTITVNNGSTTISAILAGTTSMTKAGAGNLVLVSANTYTGGTTLSAGTLTVNHASALAGGTLTITGGILANSSGSTITLAGNQNWNGNFTYSGPNNLILSGTVTLNANRTVTVDGGDLTATGVISGAFSLTKAGTNTLTLSGANTYSGGTVVNAGKILATGGGWYSTRNIGTGTLTVNTGGTAHFTNAHGFGVDPGGRAAVVAGGNLIFNAENAMSSLSMTGGSITGSGEMRLGSITIPINASTGGSTIAVGLNLAYGSPTLNVSNGTAAVDLLVTGGIYNTGGFTKSGTGFMKLSGTGTYSGTTTISAGTLQLAGGSLGGGTVTVASAATLAGSGTIGGATTVNGPLVLGVDGAIGSLGFSSTLTLASTSQTTMKISKSGSTLANDQITTGGNLACGGTLTVSASGDALAIGDTIQLFSSPTISGTFSTVTLPTLSGGLVWDTTKLYVNGTITLGKKSQTITFGALPAIAPGEVLNLDATASSGLMVTYTSSNPAVALLQFGNYLTAIGTGTTTITASQAGNAYYSPAADVAQTLTVSATLPAVSTVSPSIVNNSTVSSGGSNIWDGGASVTERGVCWSTNPTPTVADSRTTDGSGTGSFSSTATGLSGNTIYYIRAYAKNSVGYGYGGTATVVTPPASVAGVWIQNASGSWLTTTNWQSGSIPNGLGSTANFATLNISGTRTVTLDSAVTLSGLTFGDTTPNNNWVLNAGTGGSLALDMFSGAPTVTVNNQTATLGVALAGNKGLIKAGGGTLALNATNTFTGGITVNAGTLQLKPADYSNALASATQVTINSGGTLTVAAINSIGNSIGFTVNSGGTLNFTPYHCHLMGATLNGGSITGTGSAKYNNEDFALDGDITVGGSSASSITIANGIGIGNRTITVADATSSTATDLTLSGAGALRGSGVLSKAGPGTMTISNANVHTGGVAVNAGTLWVNNTTGSGTGTGSVSVAAGGTLGGSGIISGAATIAGTLAPGSAGIGTLTINNTVALTGQTLMEINKSGSTLTRDRLQGVTTLTIGGTLTVTATGDALAAGDSFALFGATTYAGSFTTITLPALGSGLAWDSSQIATSGTIAIVSTGTPQTITFGALASKNFGDAPFTLTATASSGLPVSFASSNASVVAISGNTATITGAGVATITASQAGNGTYAAAADVTQSLTVNAIAPTLSTTTPGSITSSGATSGGTISSDGGTPVTARGVCWSLAENPTLADGFSTDGAGTGNYSSSLTGLTAGTVYHVRAYATNAAGTAYGDDLTFTTQLSDNFTWSNTAGGSWPVAGNWLLDSIGTGASKTARFDTLDLSADAGVTLDGARTIGNLVFGDTTPSHGWTILPGTGGALTLQSTGTPGITVTNQSATLGTVIAGTSGFIKSGAGTLILTAANTCTGDTTINQGVLELSSTARIYNGAYNNTNIVTVNTGGTWRMPDFSYAAIGQLADYRERRVINGGVIEITGPTHSSGQNFTVGANGGTFRYSNSGGTLTLTGNANGNIRTDGALEFNSIGNTTITETVEGTGSLVKSGAGTLLLSQAGNTFSGNVTVNSGILQTGSAIGAGTNGHLGLVSGSRTVTVNTGTLSFTANNVFGGSGKTAATIPAITLNGGTLTSARFNILGNITLQGATLTQSTTDSGNYEGYQFLGTVTVGGGSASTISSGNGRANHLINGTTTFDVANATSDNLPDLIVTAPLRNSSGDYGQSAGSLAKTGVGTMQLSAANSYTGTTTVSGGTLAVTGSIAASATTVASGATLAGTGTIGGAVTNNGTLSPGMNAAGDLTVSNTLTLAPDSAIEWQIADWNGAAGTGYDRLIVNAANITATSANPTTIRISGNPLNFSETSKTFLLVQSFGATTGFAAAKFAIDTTELTAGAGTWAVQPSGNNLLLSYTRANTAPAFASDPINVNATQGTAITGQLSAIDTDSGETLTYAKVAGPAWLSVSPTGALSGTPANGDVGNASFTVSVTDSFNATDTAELQITVANLNDTPVFNGTVTSVADAAEDTAYSTSIASLASDPDSIHGDTLVFSKISGPSWIGVSAAGTLSGTPANADVGTSPFTIRATDSSGLFAETTLQVMVTNTNDAPAFASDPINEAATEDTAFSAQLIANDVDAGDTLTFTKISGPSWLAVSSSGALSGTPLNSDVGLNTFVVQVADAANASTTATLQVTVANTNDSPVFSSSSLSGPDASTGTAYTASIAGTASDPDAEDTISYSKIEGPAWLTVSPNGDLSGTPLSTDAGSNDFTVRVTDSHGLHSQAALHIQVIQTNPDANDNGILDTWETEKFGNANAGSNPPDADPDGDGLSNLLEFALDTHPAQANASPLIHDFVTVGADQRLRLTVPKNPLATNLNFTIETCAGLNDWSATNTFVESDTATQLIVRDTQPGTRRFIRLKVSENP